MDWQGSNQIFLSIRLVDQSEMWMQEMRNQGLTALLLSRPKNDDMADTKAPRKHAYFLCWIQPPLLFATERLFKGSHCCLWGACLVRGWRHRKVNMGGWILGELTRVLMSAKALAPAIVVWKCNYRLKKFRLCGAKSRMTVVSFNSNRRRTAGQYR